MNLTIPALCALLLLLGHVLSFSQNRHSCRNKKVSKGTRSHHGKHIVTESARRALPLDDLNQIISQDGLMIPINQLFDSSTHLLSSSSTGLKRANLDDVKTVMNSLGGLIVGTTAFSALSNNRYNKYNKGKNNGFFDQYNSRGGYRLFESDSIDSIQQWYLLPLKQAAQVFNLVADLLRIQGDNSIYTPELLKNMLVNATAEVQPNGLKASKEQRENIRGLCESLEQSNPTSSPALSNKMNGYWRMLYTDFEPAAASSGKLGPFIGKVYQNLEGTVSPKPDATGTIRNILDINMPPIRGSLVASQRIYNKNTWEITFSYIENIFLGITMPRKEFPGIGSGEEQIRLWEITYLDNDLRIMRARRKDEDEDEGGEMREKESFIFILKKCQR